MPIFNFEIIENASPKWNEIIKQAETYDFHHTAFFHKIDNKFRSVLLYFSSEENFIALPIVLRPIENTPYWDVTSVYGYSGPVYKFQSPAEKDALINFFKNTFIRFCEEFGVISVFARLHPVLSQRKILDGMGQILDLNRTVGISLNMAPEDQRKVYRKSLKSELNQLRRKELMVVTAYDHGEIDAFIKIYYETMDRVNASQDYYFSQDYFYQFLQNRDFEAKLLVCKERNNVIAGAIFTNSEKIIQYHLAGTSSEYIKIAPMKLIIDEARLWGNQTAAGTLHLGGGVGGSDEDSLFRFKSAFSDQYMQFSVWRFIVNKEVYGELSQGKEMSNYFPLYRS